MFLFPIKGNYYYVQGFGENKMNYAQFGMKGHNGIDWGCNTGTPIVAPDDGVIVEIQDGDTNTNAGGYGNHVRLLTVAGDNNLFYDHIFGHLLKVYVTKGQQVKKGDFLGLSNNTGFSSGPHLHWGIRKVQQVNGSSGPLDVTRTYLDKQYILIDYNNGYFGCFDFAPLLKGIPEDLLEVDTYYGQQVSATREWWWRIRNESYAKAQVMKASIPYDSRIMKACVYGFWDIETICRPEMFAIWCHMTKPAYLQLIKK